MDNYLKDELEIGVSESANRIRLAWKGKSSARDPGMTLLPFFDEVIDRARRSNSQVDVDLRALEYFNSATLAAIIRALQRSKRAGVKVVVMFDGGVGWQARSCDALKVLEDAEGMLVLRDAGRAA